MPEEVLGAAYLLRAPGLRRWQATVVVACFPPLLTSCFTSHCRGSLVRALRMFTPFFTLALWGDGERQDIRWDPVPPSSPGQV